MNEKKVLIKGVEIWLSEPTEIDIRWVGQEDLMNQVLAAWTIIDKNDLPLNPRLIGKPGTGKTTLAYTAAKKISREVFMFQATMDTRPEDLIITPVIGENNTIRYMASSIVSAMIRGGVAIVDEGNRMNEKAWASLAPLLDRRRYVESIVAGVKIIAHPNFRFITTMNDDASTYELPEYINSRLQPKIYLDFPEWEDEFFILKDNLPFLDDQIISYVVDFLQESHQKDLPYSIRDGINIARYCAKLIKNFDLDSKKALDIAFKLILGKEIDEFDNE